MKKLTSLISVLSLAAFCNALVVPLAQAQDATGSTPAAGAGAEGGTAGGKHVSKFGGHKSKGKHKGNKSHKKGQGKKGGHSGK